MNPYEELGVPKDATKAEVKRAYRKKAQAAHPDKGGDTAAFQRANRAFKLLSDDTRRARFDATGEDDARPDNRRAEALNLVAGMVLQVIDNVDVDRTDILALVRKNIQAQIKATEAQQAEMRRGANIRERAMKRIKVKGDNYLASMIAVEVAKTRAMAEGGDQNIARFNEALEILKEYGYELKAEPREFNTLYMEINIK